MSVKRMHSAAEDTEDAMLSPTLQYTYQGLVSPNTPVLKSQLTMAHIVEAPPKVKIMLLPRKLVINVLITCVFLAAFTAAAYKGIVLQKFTVQTDDKAKYAMIDDRVELYNTISGFLVALVETGLGVYMNNFLPAFLVYLHNSLWYLHSNATATKWTNSIRSAVMFIFPVFLMLVIGQSLRSFQAAQSSVGFVRIMSMKDLAPDVSVTELLKLNSTIATADKTNTTIPEQVSLGILRGAVNGTSIPFDLNLNSRCNIQRGGLKIGLADLDSATVSYGFPPREWYSEMLDTSLSATYIRTFNQSFLDSGKTYITPEFDQDLALDLFAKGKILLDRAVAESMTSYDACDVSGALDLGALLNKTQNTNDEDELASLRCIGTLSTLVEIDKFHKLNNTLKTPGRMVNIISKSLGIAIEGLNVTSTVIELRRDNLTSQIQTETLTVIAEINIDTDNDFFNGSSTIYEYGDNAKSLCGSRDCVFVDPNNKLVIPHEIMLLPHETGCSYAAKNITYRTDLRTFIPKGCTPAANSAVAVAISSYITADSYGSNVTRSYPSRKSQTPFLRNPRRVLRLTMTKFNWQTSNLDEEFEAVCDRSDSQKCDGLAYRLSKTRRYVFSSVDAMPTAAIQAASLVQPIKLVHLNKARVYVEKWDQVILERLRWQSGNIKNYYWKNLQGASCSLFMSSYIDHIENNGYFLERPYHQIARSTMFYLFSGGSVTELNTQSIAADATLSATTQDDQLGQQALANIKLKGDKQYRKIRVVVPRNTFKATIIGCGLLFLIALVIVIFPAQAIEYFSPDTTTPQKYIEVMKADKYPSAVNKKTLLFPATGDSLPIEDFDVDQLVLVNNADPSDEITFAEE